MAEELVIRRAFVVLTMVLGVLVVPAVAGAQYQPGQPGLVLIPSTVVVGGAVTATGFGCRPGQSVVLTIDGTTVATTIAKDDSTGSFEATFTAPGTPGNYTVVATCGLTIVSSILTVIAQPTTTVVSSTLPQTGSGDTTMALARYGLVLLVAGGLVVLAVRRRRTTAS
jgi:LPXTG-motif cell wall-anchored protein